LSLPSLSTREYFCTVAIQSNIAGGKEAEGVSEQGVEENIWTEEERGNGGLEEIA
jgi:hypothetical protein